MVTTYGYVRTYVTPPHHFLPQGAMGSSGGGSQGPELRSRVEIFVLCQTWSVKPATHDSGTRHGTLARESSRHTRESRSRLGVCCLVSPLEVEWNSPRGRLDGDALATVRLVRGPRSVTVSAVPRAAGGMLCGTWGRGRAKARRARGA